jgi:N-acetylglucosamine-6-phosphate deacetylase
MNSNAELLLRHARVVSRGGVTDGASVLIRGDRIARVTDDGGVSQSQGGSERDLHGLTLFPGFIDVHIHGAVGVDTMEASADNLARVSEFLARQGVTSWLPTLVPGSPENYQTAVRAIDELMRRQTLSAGQNPGIASGDSDSWLPGGARVLGVHYEGPFVNSAQCGALRSAYFRSFSSLADLESLAVPQETASTRMMTVAPEIRGGVNLIHALNRQGWIVSIGHTRADTDVLENAFKAGARHLTHFMNAMPPLHHRSPGPVGWGLSRDDVTCDLIADGVHLDPLMLKLLVKLKSSGRLVLISDAIAAAGEGDGEYRIWGETIGVKNGRTQNERGSIAGSVITMLEALRMMRSLGVDETDLALMTATNAARLLGIDRECGSIEAGKRADLVGLDGSGKVRLTIIGGRVAFAA